MSDQSTEFLLEYIATLQCQLDDNGIEPIQPREMEEKGYLKALADRRAENDRQR